MNVPTDTTRPGGSTESTRRRRAGHGRRLPAFPPRGMWVVAGLGVVLGTVGRFLPRGDLWLDEALSVNIAQQPLGEIGAALRRDGHPPLYYWLLHGWMDLLGDSPAAVRSLSAVIGLLWIPLLAITVRRIMPTEWHHRVTPAAITAAAALPYGLRYGSETRMYSLVILLVTVLVWLLIDHLERPRFITLAGIAGTTAALLWSHYWSLYLIAVIGLVALVRRAWRIAAALVVGGVLFLPWVPTFLYQAAHTGTPWGTVFRPTSVVLTTLVDLAGGPISEAQLIMCLLVGLMVLAVAGHALGPGGEEEAVGGRVGVRIGPPVRPRPAMLATVAMATLLIGSLAAIVAGATFATRYAAVVYPLLVMLVAIGAAVPATVTVRALMLAGIICAGGAGLAREHQQTRTQAGVVVEAVAERTRATGVVDPLIVTCPDQLGPAITRASGSRSLTARVLPYPTLDNPRFVDWVDYGARNDAADPSAIARNIRDIAGDGPVFVVMNTTYRTFEGDCETLLAGISEGRPAARQLVDGTSERYYEGMSLFEVPSP